MLFIILQLQTFYVCLYLFLQKRKVKHSKTDEITKQSNAIHIQNKKTSVRNAKVSYKIDNNYLESNKIVTEFNNINKDDNAACNKTVSKSKKKPLKYKSNVKVKDNELQTVEIQPKDINKNKQLQKKQSNNTVTENIVNKKSSINGKNNNIEKRTKLNVPMTIVPATVSIDSKGRYKSPKKRKANGNTANEQNDTSLNIKVKDLDFDKADELLVNAKKKKLNQVYQQEDIEVELFPQENKNRLYLKKQKIKRMLDKNDVNRNSIKVNGNDLRTRMLERLKGNHLKSIHKLHVTCTLSAWPKKLFNQGIIQ